MSVLPNPRTAYDEVGAELTATSPVTTGALFGMPCLKYGGKAFAGFYRDAVVFKLGGVDHAKALGLEGSHLFDPTGRDRPMKAWVVVAATHSARWLEFARDALRYSGYTG